MVRRTPTPPLGRAVAAAVAGLLALSLAGCARLGVPVGAPETDRVVTSSIKPAAGAALADPSDWEAIRRALAGALESGEMAHLEWTNPDTGSFGVVTAAPAGKNAACRPFDTTMSDVRGVRRYTGEVCRMTDGRWALKSVRPADASLS